MKLDLQQFITDKTFVRESQRFSFGTYQECEDMFLEAFKLTDKTMQEFEMLPEYKEVIEWLSDNKGKGLFMTGSVGRGKSSILLGVLPLLFLARARKVIKPIAARELLNKKLEWAVCIDEVGQEVVVNDYGTKVDAVENAICHCEDRMKLLIMTSNLNKEQIIKRYGTRISDRIDRLCKVVTFKGESFRK